MREGWKVARSEMICRGGQKRPISVKKGVERRGEEGRAGSGKTVCLRIAKKKLQKEEAARHMPVAERGGRENRGTVGGEGGRDGGGKKKKKQGLETNPQHAKVL